MEYGSDISPKNIDAKEEKTFTSIARKPATATHVSCVTEFGWKL
jgi:hypothetical protein